MTGRHATRRGKASIWQQGVQNGEAGVPNICTPDKAWTPGFCRSPSWYKKYRMRIPWTLKDSPPPRLAGYDAAGLMSSHPFFPPAATEWAAAGVGRGPPAKRCGTSPGLCFFRSLSAVFWRPCDGLARARAPSQTFCKENLLWHQTIWAYLEG